MKGLITLMLLAALTGCSAKQVKPEATPSQLFRTPIEGATAQLILSQDFQKAVITQSPSWGRSWKPFDFEVPVGEPMSKALAYDIRSRVPAARVGNNDDGKPATILIVPSKVAIQFGVDDGAAVFWTSVSPIGLGSDIVVSAKADLTASVSIGGAPLKVVVVEGVGAIPMAYISIREADIGRAVGLALDNAALKMGDLVESGVKK